MSRLVDQWTIPVDLTDPQARGQVIRLYNRMMREKSDLLERLQTVEGQLGQQRAVIEELEARIARQSLALKVARQKMGLIAAEEGQSLGEIIDAMEDGGE